MLLVSQNRHHDSILKCIENIYLKKTLSKFKSGCAGQKCLILETGAEVTSERVTFCSKCVKTVLKIVIFKKQCSDQPSTFLSFICNNEQLSYNC